MITAMHSLWVRRLLDPSDGQWKTLMLHYIGYTTHPYNLSFGIFDPAAEEIPIPARTPQVFKTMMKAWRKVQGQPNRLALHPDQYRNQNIFYNSDILIYGLSVNKERKSLALAGFTTVEDFSRLHDGRGLKKELR